MGFELDDVGLDHEPTPVTGPPTVPAGVRFLKGPIPLPWLAAAGALPGKALHVGVAVWHLVGLNRSATVKVSYKLLASFGVSRHSAYRALSALESAGLVEVERARERARS